MIDPNEGLIPTLNPYPLTSTEGVKGHKVCKRYVELAFINIAWNCQWFLVNQKFRQIGTYMPLRY
jgi:hypothetical protein